MVIALAALVFLFAEGVAAALRYDPSFHWCTSACVLGLGALWYETRTRRPTRPYVFP